MTAEGIWRELTADLNENASNEWWTKIKEKYLDSKRIFHNLDALSEKLIHYESCKSSLKNSRAVGFGLFFLYYEYDPSASDNTEKNIVAFTEFCDAQKLASDNPIRNETIELLTSSSAHCTEAHMAINTFGEDDIHYILDIDMTVLGAPAEKYDLYSVKIKEEYSFMSGNMYETLRSKILRNFLLIPNIFATKDFRTKYEQQARENIDREVKLYK